MSAALFGRKENIVNKIRCLILSAFLVSALMFQNHSAASASSASAASTSYYVSTSGSDTNPGTLALPFKTIPQAIRVAAAGDTIYVRAGTYPGFEITKSGITISGYDNEIPLISGGTGIKIAGASHVTISGFEVVGAAGNWTGAITSSSGDYNVIEYNKVHDNTQSGMTGILIENGSYNRVLHNEVYNNNFVGIRIYGSSTSVMSGNEIGFNISHDQVLSGGNSDGIDIDAPLSTNAYIHDNIVYGNADDGIDTWNSSNNLIVRNVAYNQNGVGDGNGFKMGGWSGSAAGGNNTVIGNVSYNNKTAGFTTNGGSGSRYYNNTAYHNGSYGFDDGWRDFSCSISNCASVYVNNIGYDNLKGNFAAYIYTAVSHNNIWYSDNGSAGVSFNYVNYASLAAFFDKTGLDNPNGGDLASLQVNPLFVNPSGGIFDLQPSSPAIDRGDPSNPGQITAVNRVDIGASEYAGALAAASTTAPTLAPTAAQTALPASLPAYTPTAQPISQPPSTTIYDNKNSALIYSPGWSRVFNSKAYDESYDQTSVKNSYVTLTFTGQAFSILYTSGSGYSRINIYLDGVLAGTLNEKTSKIRFQQVWNYQGQLSAGTHTLRLIFVGAPKTKGSFDAVIIK